MTTQPHNFDGLEEGTVVETPDIGTLAVLNKSEIDQQIATAKRYPRSISNFRKEALQLCTLDEQTAAECIYALPRDGKTVEGPSARFAEVIAYAWGNERIGARVIGEDDQFVTSQGMFYDLEKNVGIAYEVKRRIVNRAGKKFSADMIGTTSNAASSIALRNAVLKGIPKAIWRPIYDAARKVVAGDVRTLASRRDEAIKAFQIFNITPDRIFETLGVKGKEDITIDHLVTLRGILTAIQEGDTTPEQAFAHRGDNMAEATTAKASDLAEKYRQKPAEQKQEPVNPPQASPETAEPETLNQEPPQPPRRRGRASASEPSHGTPMTFGEGGSDEER